ncbi:MAG: ABC-2 transporter permease [Eubacterium sp.]|nr:ABC-2 transporter permease [Eubacterium sp.]
MKGLLMKDLKLLKNQKSFLVIVAVMCLVLLFRGQSPVFVMSYMSVMVTILTTTTVSYDEMDNGMNFIFTFPISRRHYVLEKYLFGVLMMTGVIVAGSAVSMAVLATQSVTYDTQECIVGIFGALLSSVLFLAMMLPVQLKFGSEKTRIAMLILVGGVVLAAYAIRQLARLFSLDFSWLMIRIQQAGMVELILCALAAAVVILGISYLISAAVMMKKQF